MIFKNKKLDKKIETEINTDEEYHMGIIILGSGCRRCNDLEINVQKALDILGIAEEIEHIKDFTKIASYGIMSTPALVIDNNVVSHGRVLSIEECLEIIKKVRVVQ